MPNTKIDNPSIQLCHTDQIVEGNLTGLSPDLTQNEICCVFKSKPYQLRHFVYYDRTKKAITSATTVSKPVVEKCKPSAAELERIEKLLEMIVEREATLYMLRNG